MNEPTPIQIFKTRESPNLLMNESNLLEECDFDQMNMELENQGIFQSSRKNLGSMVQQRESPLKKTFSGQKIKNDREFSQ